MTEKERKQLYAQRTPEAPLCANCKHFYQHYTQSGVEVQCGHCAYPRVKTRMPYDACGRFQRKEVDPDAQNEA